jgi:hypothetical protein
MIGFANFMAGGGAAIDIPSGAVVMWHGLLVNIPAGYLLCDGTSGTPDLRDKFLKGAPSGDNPGVTGGAPTHNHADHAAQAHANLAVSNHAALSHAGAAVAAHSQIPELGFGGSNFYIIDVGQNGHTLSSQGDDHAVRTHTVTQASDHAAEAHVAANHEPPYYTVVFLRKT